MEKTYISYLDTEKRKQIEYTTKTELLDKKTGELLVKGGFAKRNIFNFNRDYARPKMRVKEWDFYQVSNSKYMVQISIANISIGGYVSAVLVDISSEKEEIISSMDMWLFKKNKIVLPSNGDTINRYEYTHKDFHFVEDTKENSRTISFRGPYKGEMVETEFKMDIIKDLENITMVIPFKKNGKYLKTRFFNTMKQNSMPTEGYFKIGDRKIEFSKEDTFTVLDWGRGVWTYRSVWYWGNGSTYLYDENGNKHIFGFEITWGIGDESNATETCLFYDGKAHKIGSVDVEVFPKPDKYMNEWKIISEDNRFNLTMTPVHDHHSDLNLKILRMHSHQVHGRWNGTVVLDDGKVLEIKNMYAFIEYVENRW